MTLIQRDNDVYVQVWKLEWEEDFIWRPSCFVRSACMIDDKVLYQFRFSINHCLRSLEQNSTIRFVYDKA